MVGSVVVSPERFLQDWMQNLELWIWKSLASEERRSLIRVQDEQIFF